MHAANKQLAILDRAEAVLQIDLPGADRLDLGSGKLNTSLKTFKHKVLMKRLAVIGYFFDAKLLRQTASLLSDVS